MLLSLPLRAFFGMHLTANMRPVGRSWARTTSEKAPLWGKETPVSHRSIDKRYIWVLLSDGNKRNRREAGKLIFNAPQPLPSPGFLTSTEEVHMMDTH